VGIVSLEEGQRLAEEAGLDLVEVAPNVHPPVCRIIDFSKFKYEREKRQREAHKKQRKAEIKEVRLRLYIGEHDYNVKLHQAEKFLSEGYKLKIRLFFKGREIAYLKQGQKLIEEFIEKLREKGKVERPPAQEGKQIVAIISPLSK